MPAGLRHAQAVPLLENALAALLAAFFIAGHGNNLLQGHKKHARSIQVFIHPAPFVHAEKTAHHKTIHHIHHRLRHRTIERFVSVDALLHNHFAHFQALFHLGHFVAVFAVEAAHFISRFHTHHAHAVSAGIGFYDHKRFVGDAFFIIFGLNFR